MDGDPMATRNHPGPNAAAGDPELAAVARQIIDANRYLVLGTADQHGVPWVSPVWYAHAGYREFLWVSDPQARHSRSIEARPQVSIVIFDSSVPPDAAPAVYLSGAAHVVTGSGLEKSIEIYSRRSEEQGLPEWAPANVRAPARPRLYRVVAAEQFVLPAGGNARIPVNAESLAGNRR
jgi:pyridoxine/pyridoxamine 5'-phosphate oxidase